MADVQTISDRVAGGEYERHDPLSVMLLKRLQDGTLEAPLAPDGVKAAIRRTVYP